MTFHLAQLSPASQRAVFHAVLAGVLGLASASAEPGAPAPRASSLAKPKELDSYCANIAASVESGRLERGRRELAELEGHLSERLAALESKERELRALLDRLDAFQSKSNESLVGLYARMKPEAAAAQLAQLDEDTAAALMLQLKTKVSSAILSEMEAARGAALAKKIAQLRNSMDGKRP